MDNLISKGTVGKITHIQNIFQGNLIGNTLGDMLSVFANDLRNTGANRSKAQNCNINHTVSFLSQFGFCHTIPRSITALPEFPA